MRKRTRLKQFLALLLVVTMTMPMMAEPLAVRAASEGGENEVSSQDVIVEENLMGDELPEETNSEFEPVITGEPVEAQNEEDNLDVPEEAQTYTVSGKVTCGGEPVAEANVTIGDKSAATLEDGSYTIEGVAAGEAKIQAEKNGFEIGSTNVTISEDVQTADITLNLSTPVVISENPPSEVDGTGTFSVDPVEGVTYSWSVSEAGKIQGEASGSSVEVKAVKAGDLRVNVAAAYGQATANGSTNTPVNMKRPEVKITVTPTNGDGLSALDVTVEVVGVGDKGTVSFFESTGAGRWNGSVEGVALEYGMATREYVTDNPEGFRGDLSFEVTYSGADGYYYESSSLASGSYKAVKEIKLKDEDVYGNSMAGEEPEISVEYGKKYSEQEDANYKIEVDTDASDVGDGTYSYSVINDNGETNTGDAPYTVDEQGLVTFTRASRENEKTGIKILRSGSAEYADAEKIVWLTVTKRQIEIDGYTASGEVTYNAETAFVGQDLVLEDVTFKRPSNSGENTSDQVAVLDGEELKLEKAKGDFTLNSKNVGSYENTGIQNIELEIEGANKDNYEVKIPEAGISADITVSPRNYHIRIADSSREYGQTAEYTKEPELAYDTLTENEGFIQNASDANTEFEAIKAAIGFNDTSTATSPLYTYKEADTQNPNAKYIEPYFKEGVQNSGDGSVVIGNYSIINDEENSKGYLKITQQKIDNWSDYVQYGGTNVYEASGSNWWMQGQYTDTYSKEEKGGKFEIRINTELYNTVEIFEGEGYTVDEDNKVSASLAEGQISTVTITYKLLNKVGDAVLADTEQQTVELKIDSGVPTVDQIDEPELTFTPLDSFTDKITFGLWKKGTYSVKVNAADQPQDGVGLGNVSYLVLDINANASKEDILNAADGKVWSPGGAETDIPVYTGNPDNVDPDTILENKVILVCATDNVNNSRIYTSNGIIIDNYLPTITVKGIEDSYNIEELENGQIEFSLSIQDNTDATDTKKAVSGIDQNSIEVKLVQYDENEQGYKEADSSYGVEKTDVSESEDGSVTAFYTINNINENTDLKTNNLYIQASAKDKAGNSITARKQLLIALTPPEIEISYPEGNEKGEIENYPDYFKSRTVYVTIKERNYDEENSKILLSYQEPNGSEIQQTISLAAPANDYVTIKKLSDSAENDNPIDYPEDRTIKYELFFEKEGIYSFEVSSTDKAGNTGEPKAAKEFKIDKTAADITIDYGNEEDNPVHNDKYYQNARTATVTFSEYNFAPELAGITLTYKQNLDTEKEETRTVTFSNIEEKNNTLELFSGNLILSTKRNEEERKYSIKVEFNGDGEYFVNSINITDKANNKTNVEGKENTDFNFIIDGKGSEGTISVEKISGTWSTFLKVITFNIFADEETLQVDLKGRDNTSGVDYIQYLTSPKAYTEEELKSIQKWETKETEGEEVLLEQSLNVNANSQFVEYLKVVDNAGNISYFSSDGVIQDIAEPEWLKAEIFNGNESDYYTQDVRIDLRIQDPLRTNTVKPLDEEASEDTYSGLADLWYTVSATRIVNEQTGEITDNSKTVYLIKDGKIQSDENASKIQMFEKSIVIPADEFNSNNVTVTLHATDKAGNEAENKEFSFIIDKTKPQIDLSYEDALGDASIGYFMERRNATVKFIERNFDPDTTTINITTMVAQGEGRRDSSKQTKEFSYKFAEFVPGAEILDGKAKVLSVEDNQAELTSENYTDKREITYQIAFLGDADYRIEALECIDVGGLTTNMESAEFSYSPNDDTAFSFNVDTTAPDYANITIGKENWINQFFDTITFHLFSNEDVQVAMEAKDKDSPVERIEYIRAPKGMTEKELDAETGWETIGTTMPNSNMAEGKLTVEPNEQFVIYTKITNYAGLMAYYSSDGQIVDDVEGNITITETNRPDDGVYKSDAILKIHVEDPHVDGNNGGTYSGIEKVEYRIIARGNMAVDSGWITLEERSEKVQNSEPVEKNITISAETYNSNDVTVYVRAWDFAGNITEEGQELPETNKIELAFDTTEPYVSIEYDKNDATHNQYFDEIRTGTVTFRERNFVPAYTSISLEATDVNGTVLSEGEYTFEELENVAVNSGKILDGYVSIQKISDTEVQREFKAFSDQREITYQFVFEGDANYQIRSINITDLAHNETIASSETDSSYVTTNNNIAPYEFTVDKTAPMEGSVEVHGQGLWDRFVELITFRLFSNQSVDISMTGRDDISPVEPIRYYVSTHQMSKEELRELPDSQWTEGNSLRIDPDQQFVIYEKVTNYALLSEFYSSDGVVVDITEPAPVVTITNLSQSQNGIFNEDVTLQIDVEDPYAGADPTYSGLERVWYTVSAAGNVNTGETIELLNNSNDRVQSNQTFSQIITVPASVYNSNDVKVQAFAVDFSGNQGESEVTEMKIDVTNPTISVSWDLNNPLNGSYYKDTRTATVTVTDRNFDPNNVRFSITNTDGTEASIGGWSSSSDIGVSDNATSTCQVAFPADGDYTFTLGCTDLAGNSTEYGQTDEFTIDKTVPEISVSYNNNSARNGNYYNEARTATVTVREHNFNAADVKAAITASLEGRGISAPSISGFSGSGDVHTATVTYGTDGDYTFDVEYTDMAGNAAADYTPDDFTVDLTEPEIEITDVADKSANNDVVSPSVKATDVNYDAQNVTVTITGANNGKVNIGNVVSAIENGQTIKFNDFARQEKMDDLYTLTAKAVDMAGNEKEESILFSVNRYGSVYVLDGDTKDWLSTKDYTYINEEKEVGVVEYNVDTIKESQITVNRDGELTNLKAKEDYKVTSAGTEAQWKENHYVLDAENFETEGNYSVIFSTQDEAGNAMNNTSVKKSNQNLPIEFAVDKTAPTVVISGVEDRGSYRSAERTMTVDAKDNLALDEVIVTVDGESQTYKAEELAEIDGIIDVVIASANNFQEIEVTASDAAGNVLGQKEVNDKGQPVTLSVLVTPNIVVQYYMNKPLFFGSIIGVLVIAGVIIFLVVRKSRKNEGKR